MRITDLRRSRQSEFYCDVCIVGGGPAGLTLATELANISLKVLLVESGGGPGQDAFANGLNEIESVGSARVMDQDQVRNRGIGGSSQTWFGRCISLDPIDFECRDWLPYSGWPISLQELQPFIKRSVPYLGLGEGLYTGGFPADSKLSASLQSDKTPTARVVTWQFSSRSTIYSDYVRFGIRFRTLQAPNIVVLTHATITQIKTAEQGSRVERLEVTTPEGEKSSIIAHQIVLCGGGIENARLLLASNRSDPRGVGNQHDLVGRFFMDHPRTTVGTFTTEAAPAVQREFGLFRVASGVRVQCGLSLATDVQRKEQLLNCAAWTTQHVADDDAWRSVRAVGLGNSGSRLAAARVVARNADQLAIGLWNKFVRGENLTRRLKQLDLDVMVEQTPNPQSRIRLSKRLDATQVPLSEIDWKISEVEALTVIRLSHAVNATLSKAGLPECDLVDWVANKRVEDAVFRDAAHPLGATRMALRAEDGVVDPDCRVFGIENLYIAGSSVFPYGGHANPTLTIIALALRLADHLRNPALYRQQVFQGKSQDQM